MDWRLLIAQLVNFLILFVLLKRFLYRPVLDMLERRRARIAEGLRDAERSAERLAGIEIERKQVLDAAALERQRVLEAAVFEAEQLRERRVQAAEVEAAGVLVRARDEAERTRRELLAEVRREVGDLVVAISEKVTADILTEAQHGRLVERAVAELRVSELSRQSS